MAKISNLFKDFTESEKSAGYMLIGATVVSLILANLVFGSHYTAFFHQKFGFDTGQVHLRLSLEHWINDGLMAIFFFLVGLEIEREVYVGELSTLKKAALPIAAAVGGMIVPFLIHLAFNSGTPTERGYGIPMATDIAFALGILSLVRRVPHSLKIFLTAFAIIDDLGAIIVIALFYTANFSLAYLLAALGVFGFMLVLNRLRVFAILPYILLGIVMWFCMLQSGVHATIAGVLTAFAMPFGDGGEQSPSYRVQHFLHKPFSFIILPLFALANTGIVISDGWLSGLISNNSLGIILGLLIGKPVGILLLCFTVTKIGLAQLPDDLRWSHVTGASILGGIGFTMSIFITMLAFSDGAQTNESKIAILVSSLVASVIGLWTLKQAVKRL